MMLWDSLHKWMAVQSNRLGQIAWPRHLQSWHRVLVGVSHRCELQCYRCSVGKERFSPELPVGLKRAKWWWRFVPLQIDIGVGDPVLSPAHILSVICQKPLHSQINLWTHGTGDWTSIIGMLSQIDRVFLYAPKLDETGYLAHTGRNGLSRLDDAIGLLNEYNVAFTIVQHVSETDIPDLANDYDWIWARKAEWVLFCKCSMASVKYYDYLLRFNRLPNGYVLVSSSTKLSVCQGYLYSN